MTLKTKVITTLVCALALLSQSALADGDKYFPAKSSGDFRFYLDTASFRSSLQNTYQEFYYQIPLGELDFVDRDSLLVDTLKISFALQDSNGARLFADTWRAPIIATPMQELKGRFIPSQFDLLLEPGNYQAIMDVEELTTGRTGTARLSFVANRFDDSTFALSSVQFASDAHRDTTASKFNKNGINILPNPSRTFGIALPMLVFYFEVYNLAADSTFEISYRLQDSHGQAIRSFPVKKKYKKGATSSAEIGAVSVAGLTDTLYTLIVSVTDNATGHTVQRQASFRNIPIDYKPTQESEVALFINNLSDEELKLHIRQAKYILTKEELDLLKTLDDRGKRKAMIEFWDRRDPDPKTAQNEFWRQYMNRVRLANQRYSRGFEPGWLSDRGRILIKYGIPSEIERHPMSIDSRPYEVWFYQQGRGYRFIFVDESGFNRYRLIYSNMEGEIGDPNWKQIIDYR